MSSFEQFLQRVGVSRNEKLDDAFAKIFADNVVQEMVMKGCWQITPPTKGLPINKYVAPGIKRLLYLNRELVQKVSKFREFFSKSQLSTLEALASAQTTISKLRIRKDQLVRVVKGTRLFLKGAITKFLELKAAVSKRNKSRNTLIRLSLIRLHTLRTHIRRLGALISSFHQTFSSFGFSQGLMATEETLRTRYRGLLPAILSSNYLHPSSNGKAAMAMRSHQKIDPFEIHLNAHKRDNKTFTIECNKHVALLCTLRDRIKSVAATKQELSAKSNYPNRRMRLVKCADKVKAEDRRAILFHETLLNYGIFIKKVQRQTLALAKCHIKVARLHSKVLKNNDSSQDQIKNGEVMKVMCKKLDPSDSFANKKSHCSLVKNQLALISRKTSILTNIFRRFQNYQLRESSIVDSLRKKLNERDCLVMQKPKEHISLTRKKMECVSAQQKQLILSINGKLKSLDNYIYKNRKNFGPPESLKTTIQSRSQTEASCLSPESKEISFDKKLMVIELDQLTRERYKYAILMSQGLTREKSLLFMSRKILLGHRMMHNRIKHSANIHQKSISKHYDGMDDLEDRISHLDQTLESFINSQQRLSSETIFYTKSELLKHLLVHEKVETSKFLTLKKVSEQKDMASLNLINNLRQHLEYLEKDGIKLHATNETHRKTVVRLERLLENSEKTRSDLLGMLQRRTDILKDFMHNTRSRVIVQTQKRQNLLAFLKQNFYNRKVTSARQCVIVRGLSKKLSAHRELLRKINSSRFSSETIIKKQRRFLENFLDRRSYSLNSATQHHYKAKQAISAFKSQRTKLLSIRKLLRLLKFKSRNMTKASQILLRREEKTKRALQGCIAKLNSYTTTGKSLLLLVRILKKQREYLSRRDEEHAMGSRKMQKISYSLLEQLNHSRLIISDLQKSRNAKSFRAGVIQGTLDQIEKYPKMIRECSSRLKGQMKPLLIAIKRENHANHTLVVQMSERKHQVEAMERLLHALIKRLEENQEALATSKASHERLVNVIKSQDKIIRHLKFQQINLQEINRNQLSRFILLTKKNVSLQRDSQAVLKALIRYDQDASHKFKLIRSSFADYLTRVTEKHKRFVSSSFYLRTFLSSTNSSIQSLERLLRLLKNSAGVNFRLFTAQNNTSHNLSSLSLNQQSVIKSFREKLQLALKSQRRFLTWVYNLKIQLLNHRHAVMGNFQGISTLCGKITTVYEWSKKDHVASASRQKAAIDKTEQELFHSGLVLNTLQRKCWENQRASWIQLSRLKKLRCSTTSLQLRITNLIGNRLSERTFKINEVESKCTILTDRYDVLSNELMQEKRISNRLQHMLLKFDKVNKRQARLLSSYHSQSQVLRNFLRVQGDQWNEDANELKICRQEIIVLTEYLKEVLRNLGETEAELIQAYNFIRIKLRQDELGSVPQYAQQNATTLILEKELEWLKRIQTTPKLDCSNVLPRNIIDGWSPENLVSDKIGRNFGAVDEPMKLQSSKKLALNKKKSTSSCYMIT